MNKLSLPSFLQIRLATRILVWVICPMLLFSAATFSSIKFAGQQSDILLDQQMQVVDANRLLTQNSNALTQALLEINKSLVQMENTRRANLAAAKFDPVLEVKLRAELQKSIRSYLKGMIAFSSAVERSGIEAELIRKHVIYLTRVAGQIDRLTSIYLVSNSRTLRLAGENNFEAARNNFRFDELFKTRTLRHFLDQASARYAELSETIVQIQSESSAAQILESRQEQAQLQEVSQIALAATVLLVALIAFISVRRSIIRPVRSIPERIRQTGQNGQAEQAAMDRNRKDEIGDILVAVSDFGDRIEQEQETQKRAAEHRLDEQTKAINSIGHGLSEVAQGNLAVRLEQTLPEGYERLGSDFNKAVENLDAIVSQVVESSISIENAAVELDMASQEMSQRTEGQAAALEQTAAAVEEITTSVQQTARNSSHAKENMDEALNDAGASQEVVGDAVDAMDTLAAGSEQISNIVNIIDDIAFQTNLLALNAGVEAARAGEKGRGFAVVATEVQSLAQRSSDAAVEIKTLIDDSSQHVTGSVQLVGKTGDTIAAISTRVQNISELVSGIASGAAEQSAGLSEINASVAELDMVTQKNAAMVEQTSAAIQLMTADTTQLRNLVAFFNGGASKVSQKPDYENVA